MQKIYYCTIYLLIARHYIYTCKQRDTRPNVQMYIQTVQRTVEIERQLAKDHNSLDTFKKKWSRLKTSKQQQQHQFIQLSNELGLC